MEKFINDRITQHLGIVKSMTKKDQFHTSGKLMTEYDMTITDGDDEKRGVYWTTGTPIKVGDNIRYQFQEKWQGDKILKPKLISNE